MQEHINTFVLPFLPAGDTDIHRVFRHHAAQLLLRHLRQCLAGCSTVRAKCLPFRHEVRLKPIRRNDVHGLIQQLLALPRRQVAHRREAVGEMCRLLLRRVLAHHVQFLRHLVAVVVLEIVIQRLAVTRDRPPDGGSMRGEERAYLRTEIAQVEDHKRRLPLISMRHHTKLVLRIFR